MRLGSPNKQLQQACGSRIAQPLQHSPPKPRPGSAASRDRQLHSVQVQAIAQVERPLVQQPSPALGSSPALREPEPLIAHEVVQGALVRFSTAGGGAAGRHPPTAVLVHGVLGSRRNMRSFAQQLVEGFPSWQVLLVDLRCHGDSAAAPPSGAHGVQSAAGDVLRLLSALKLFPEMLIGHSFGGKVVMSMAHQFGATTKRLPRPVRVWVLDALPGEVRSGEMGGQDRPADLITCLRRTRLPLPSRAALVADLERQGFSGPVAQWASTNLVPHAGDPGRLVWSFDLEGIAEMYRSYESTSLWDFLAAPAEGIQLSFVKAARSTFRWGGGDEDRIRALGHAVHELPRAGHWVHTDNPSGLFDILAPSFGTEPDLHMQHSPPTSPLGSPRRL